MRYHNPASQAAAEEITRGGHMSQVYPAKDAALVASYHHGRGVPVLLDFGAVGDPTHLAVGLSLSQARVLWDQLAHVLQAAEIRRQELTEAFDRLDGATA